MRSWSAATKMVMLFNINSMIWDRQSQIHADSMRARPALDHRQESMACSSLTSHTLNSTAPDVLHHRRGTQSWCICHTQLVQRLATVTCTLHNPYLIIFFATDNYSAIEMANPPRSSRLAEWSLTISLCNGPHQRWHQRDWIYISLQ